MREHRTRPYFGKARFTVLFCISPEPRDFVTLIHLSLLTRLTHPTLFVKYNNEIQISLDSFIMKQSYKPGNIQVLISIHELPVVLR